jgi:cytochrome c biogenesis protein CcdA
MKMFRPKKAGSFQQALMIQKRLQKRSCAQYGPAVRRRKMTENLSLFLAFSAGLLSFFSPCVLPLIPSWLCVIGGIGGEQRKGDSPTVDSENKPNPTARTVSFVLGFSAVFVILALPFRQLLV